MLVAPIFYFTFYLSSFLISALIIYDHATCETVGSVAMLSKFIFLACFVLFNVLTYIHSDNEDFKDLKGRPSSCLESLMRNKTARGAMLIFISTSNLLDTYLDINFVILTYIARILWVVVPVTICYILIFAEKIYCIKTLVKVAMEQWKMRRVFNLMKKPKLKFLFYSACISLDLHCIAESMVSTRMIVHQFKGLLIFSLIMNVVQKCMFILMKIVVLSIS